MHAILKFIDSLSRWAATLAIVLVYGIAVLIVAEVLSRWVFGISLSFAWEFSAYFYAVAVFCGAAYTMRTGGHVRVALFSGFLGERGRQVMDFVASLVGAGVASYAAIAMVEFAWRSYVRGSVSPTVDATPLVIPQAAVAFGLVLLALQMIARLVRIAIGEPAEDKSAQQSLVEE